MRASRVISLALLTVVAGCAGTASGPEGTIALTVAPLSLPGITEAVYTIAVTNAPGGAGEVVWTRSLSSTAYGDGGGSLSYVGPCDAASPSTCASIPAARGS